MNREKTPIMLTLTVDSNFRKYKKVNPNLEGKLGSFENLVQIDKNKDNNLQELIEASYEHLNKTFRNLYQHTKTLNMRQGMKDKLDYILIFEPHKSMTLHLHVLIYCNDIQLANLRKSWANYLLKLNKQQRKAQDYKLINRDIVTGSTYISKYLIKEYNNSEEQGDKNFFLQYKRYFSKFKLFRTSNFYHTTQKKIDYMYSYFAKNYPDLLEDMKLSDTPIYVIFEEFDIKGIFTFEIEKKNFLSIVKKEIKKYFSKRISFLPASKVREYIIDNLEDFSKKETTTKIVSATFQYSYQKLLYVFNKYEVNSKNLTNENIPQDEFYTEKTYEFVEKKINESIEIVKSI